MEETLASHNSYRIKNGKPPLQWCEQCAKAAQQWANTLASQNQFAHGNLDTPHGRVGQNLAMGGQNMSVSKAVDLWMSEQPKYCPGQNYFQPACGHYSQIVWKNTTHVGTAVAQVGNRRIVVSNYHPAGNVSGQFIANV